jgi:hypothetical protein
MTLALALAALGVVALLAGANVWLAKVAIDRTADAGKAQVERAVAAGRAENAEAALDTSERFRQQERARAAALEQELHDLEAEPVVPGPARDARNRVLRAWKNATADDADGGTGAAGAGPVGVVSGELPHRAADSDGAGPAADPPGPAGVRR